MFFYVKKKLCIINPLIHPGRAIEERYIKMITIIYTLMPPHDLYSLLILETLFYSKINSYFKA